MFLYIASIQAFYLTYIGLETYCSEWFPETTTIVNSKYRIVNTVKSVVLLGLCYPGTHFLYNLIFYPELNFLTDLNLIGSMYAATDASALIYNPNCHTSTFVHHGVVQLFYYYCYYLDFNMNNGIARGISVYCILSSYAYLVNGRLALRFSPFPTFEKYVNEVSLYIYITTCIINWLSQSYFMMGPFEMNFFERLIYMCTIGMTINDDIFLITFLRKIDYKK